MKTLNFNIHLPNFDNNFNKRSHYPLTNLGLTTSLLFFLFFISQPLSSFAQQVKLNTRLSKKIDSLKNEDQKPAMIPNGKDAEIAFKKVVRTNFPIVKNILETYDFPGYDLVGEQSSNNYWILVQHSDFDLAFQKRAQALMAEQIKRHNASSSYYAFLVDRIAINEGKKQIYGSQIQMTDSGYHPKPLIDSLNVDYRRKKVGLGPLSQYLKKANEAFNEMNKGRGHINIKGSNKDTLKH